MAVRTTAQQRPVVAIAIASLAAITGGSLGLAGLHRVAWVTAALLVAVAVVSLLGVRNPPPRP